MGWGKFLRLDSAIVGYSGRVDGLLQEGERLIELESKALAKGASKLSSTDYQQLDKKIQAAIRRSRSGGVVNLGVLATQLKNMRYSIRGAEADYPGLRADFVATAEAWLRLNLGDDAAGVLAVNIELVFPNRRLPF